MHSKSVSGEDSQLAAGMEFKIRFGVGGMLWNGFD